MVRRSKKASYDPSLPPSCTYGDNFKSEAVRMSSPRTAEGVEKVVMDNCLL